MDVVTLYDFTHGLSMSKKHCFFQNAASLLDYGMDERAAK